MSQRGKQEEKVKEIYAIYDHRRKAADALAADAADLAELHALEETIRQQRSGGET